jgi:hypothetical protein
MVAIGCTVADIMGIDLQEGILDGSLEDTDLKVGSKYFWKETEDIHQHGRILS